MKTCPRCGRSFGPGALVCSHDETALVAAPTTAEICAGPLPSGTILGNYRILKLVAQGGMGVIYRAEHIRLGRQVALKVLRSEMVQQKTIIRRFFEEARAVNEIGHPNIIDIFDFVESHDESPPLIYMVMELLSGEDLRMHLMSKGPLEAQEAVDIAAHVAETLYSVHRAEILHRDLKPENIFLLGPTAEEMEPDEEMEERTGVQWEPIRAPGPRIKLLDFGIAAYFGGRQPANLTEQGRCLGTPAYMAPEQILGRPLDERTDVYALGLVMYEMLAGCPPFSSMEYGEVLVQQVREAPAPISSIRGRPLMGKLEAIVLRCLQKDPAQRFRDMREVYSALRHNWRLTSDPPTVVSGCCPVSARPELETIVSERRVRPAENVADDDAEDNDTYPVPRPSWSEQPPDLHREHTLLLAPRFRATTRPSSLTVGLGRWRRAALAAATVVAVASCLAVFVVAEHLNDSRATALSKPSRAVPFGERVTRAKARPISPPEDKPDRRPALLGQPKARSPVEAPPVGGASAGAPAEQELPGKEGLAVERPSLRSIRPVVRPASTRATRARGRHLIARRRRLKARRKNRRLRRDGTIDPFNL